MLIKKIDISPILILSSSDWMGAHGILVHWAKQSYPFGSLSLSNWKMVPPNSTAEISKIFVEIKEGKDWFFLLSISTRALSFNLVYLIENEKNILTIWYKFTWESSPDFEEILKKEKKSLG